ncbi:hypothetical protein [Paracoccus pantotrophus]|uniref:hypothetical protein n=1 Tax=Paracoccus pantotrophus TaxID=82367 RepID=UPI00048AB2FA|nr:hypothetical protein [Paracoccus pantotrophus]
MSDEIFAAVHARPKRRQGITGQTIDAQMRGTMCQITEWELEELRAEVERLTDAHDSVCGKLAGVIAALADERAHADALMDDIRQRLSYDAETFHDQGAWDREDACLAIMKRIDLHRARRQG